MMDVENLTEAMKLSKPMLEKTERLMTKLFGPAISEYGELFADKVKFRRFKNQVVILDKARQIIEEKRLDPHELNLKTIVPLLEKSSVEDDELLQQKWAHLIGNISTTPENGLEPRLINTLSALSPHEARILDFIYDEFRKLLHAEVKELNKRPNLFGPRKIFTEKDVKLHDISIAFDDIQENFDLEANFAKIYTDNLESLGLLKHDKPKIDIDQDTAYADLVNDDDKGPSVDLNLEFSANYLAANSFHITEFGKYFIEQCKK